MRVKGVIAVLVALCLAVQSAGCSWVFMDSVPENYNHRQDLKCSGYSAPILDGILATALIVVGSVWFANTPKEAEESCDPDVGFGCFPSFLPSNRQLASSLIVYGVVFAFSAATGTYWAYKCDKAREKQKEIMKEIMKVNLALRDEKIRKKQRLQTAIDRCDKETAKLLIKIGDDINAKDMSGITPLHKAAAQGKQEIIEFLIENEAYVNARTPSGWTPLHYAAGLGHMEVAELLISNGADVNARDNKGQTPLYRAVLRDSMEIAGLLIDNFADVNARTFSGITPLGMAIQLGNKEMAELLREHGGRE